MVKEDLVKIIPRAKPKAPFYVNLFFWLSVILLLALVGLYFFLDNQIPSLEKKIKKLETELKPSESQKTLEEEMFFLSKRINDFPQLLAKHKFTSNLFDFLKEFCHPQVQFTSLEIDTQESKVILSGITESFYTLGEQILVLQEKEEIKGLRLSRVSLDREGKVNFDLAFTFSENLIKK